MGKELDVAGNFLYDGLRNFDEIHNLNETSSIFNFMYNISVGVERMQKVAIILCAIEEETDFEKLTLEIKHHNHVSLMDKIRRDRNIKLKPNENEFLNVLNNFYNDLRYGRYLLDDFHLEDEKNKFIKFLDRLGIEENALFGTINNNDRIRKFIGGVVGGISINLYELIVEESRKLGIYTYEVNYHSKAYKIFTEKRFDFILEKLSLKELIVYLLNSDELEDLRVGIKYLDALDLDIYSLGALESFIEKRELTEAVETSYEEIPNAKRNERKQILNLLVDESTDWIQVKEYLLKSNT